MVRSAAMYSAFLLLALSGEAEAAQLITQIIDHDVADHVTELEIALDIPVVLTTTFRSTNGRTFEADLRYDGAENLDWQMAELALDEGYKPLDRVTVEGSVDKGYRVRVEFASPVAAATLPQHAGDRIGLKYLPRGDFRKAVRSSNGRSDDDLWAIELGDQAVLDVGDVPRSVLINRALYYRPAESGNAVRLGTFDRVQAGGVLRELQGRFPGAKLVAVNRAEADYASAMRINSERVARLYAGTGETSEADASRGSAPGLSINVASAPDEIEAPAPAPAAALKDWQSEPDDSVLQEARDAYLAGDYNQAIALYTKASKEPAFRLEALEMLGVAREQKGQTAHAKHVYETVLAEFPGTETARRVDGRLRALVSIDKDPRTLRLPEDDGSGLDWNVVASVSQFYRRHSIDIESRGKTVPIDGLFTDGFMSIQRIGPQSSHELRVSLGHIQDFSDRDDGRSLRIQELYWDSRSERLHAGIRAGRQRQRRSGVLGRFDGVTATYIATSQIEVNALAGYLVDSSYDSPDSNRSFWGINAEIDLLDDVLSVVPFYVQQNYDGVLDRQAVGLQAEYYSDRASYYGMVDYDLHHKVLNHFYVNANFRLAGRTRLYGGVDHRRNPYLTTRNALIGQTIRDLSELELLLVEESLEDIARDRSALSTMYRLGVQGYFSDNWAYSLDTSLTSFEATETSLNVNALDSHQDLYFGAQIRAENMFGQGNYGAIQARVYDSDMSRSVGMYANNRFTLGESWWLYPRLQVDQRTQLETDQDQLRVRPSLRLDYRYNRGVRFELEAGYEWTDRDMAVGSLITRGIFIRAGYRANF